MQIHKTAVVAVFLAMVLFAIGWLVHPWLVDALTGNISIVSGQLDGWIAHRLLTSAAFALLGAVLGMILCVRQQMVAQASIVVITIVTLGATWIFLKKDMAALDAALIVPTISVPIAEIRIYLMGVVPSCAIAVCAIVLFLKSRICSPSPRDQP
jgi:hypothetical protein